MTPPEPIRVLVVEDSPTVRNRILDALARDPVFRVVGICEDGLQAIEKCHSLRPDVITMDMVLPRMDGLEAVRRVMAECPTPVLIVSSSTNRRDLFASYDALAAGAVDVLNKPDGVEPDEVWNARLLRTLHLVSRIPVVTRTWRIPGPRTGATGSGNRTAAQVVVPADPVPVHLEPPTRSAAVVALGASTGGPGALVEILTALPADFGVPVLVVQHLDDLLGGSFVSWLAQRTGRRVRTAYDGEFLSATAGSVIVAPPGRHLVVGEGRLHLDDGPQRHFCRPSVDTLFSSVAHEYGERALACLLTGMGRDGADGLAQVRAWGGVTIAQDAATSVVHGMPREAVLLDAAEHVLPLGEIASALVRLVRRPVPEHRVGDVQEVSLG